MSRVAGLAHRIPVAARQALETRRRRRFEAQLAGPRLLQAFGRAFPRASFVEIGANDGLQHDHLRPLIDRLEWRGVMVEPVPYVFSRLQSAYRANPRISLENAAVADRTGRLPFYHLAPVSDYRAEGLPRWYDGIGSFSRAAVLGHGRLIPDIQERVVETEVPTLTFDALCAKHRLERVDLVLIDAEGYDHVILADINWEHHRPVLVVYEHYHLDGAQRSACAERMHRHGFQTLEEGFDTWCLRPDADAALTRIWRGMRPGAPGLYVEDEAR